MAEFVKVAAAASIAPGAGATVVVSGKALALFRVGGQYFAVDNACRHRGGPLGEGTLEGTTVTCPWHGWQFDVSTGACVFNPGIAVGCYPTKIEDGEVWVEA